MLEDAMPNRLIAGLAAGAAGTAALNITGYLDMLVRGRPASDLPARVAGEMAAEVGLPLDFPAPRQAGSVTPAQVDNRREAVGALLGYSNGIGFGLAYGLARLFIPRLPLWLSGAILGGAAMAASDIPATGMRLTDPQQWSTADWIADVLPHAAFGVVTALTFEALHE
jgi:predicted outer membrane lipoprotein